MFTEIVLWVLAIIAALYLIKAVAVTHLALLRGRAVHDFYNELSYTRMLEEELIDRILRSRSQHVQRFLSLKIPRLKEFPLAEIDEDDPRWMSKQLGYLILDSMDKNSLITLHPRTLDCLGVIEIWHQIEPLDDFDRYRFIEFLMTGRDPWQFVAVIASPEGVPAEELRRIEEEMEELTQRIEVVFVEKRPRGGKPPRNEETELDLHVAYA